MSKRPFITQDYSPNIVIVPTLSFCGPPQKTTKIDNEKVQTTPCVQTLSLSKNSESSSESITENSITNTSAESSESKSGDSSQSLPSVNVAAKPKPSSSWASNYLMSIGDSHGPIKPNLSPFRKKIETPKESASQNKSAHYESLSPTGIKKAIPSEESRGPSRITSGSSISISKDILTKNVHAVNLSSLPKTHFTSEETNTKKKMNRVSEYETQTSAKKSKISSEMIGTNQRLHKATESHTRHGDKISAKIPSKYISTPDKYKYNKYNQISPGHKKPTKDGVNKPSYPCNSSCCTANNIRDKITTSQNKIVKTSKQNLKEFKKYTTEKYVKSTVTKKSSPIKHKQPYYSADYLKSYKNYDIQTIKCKEFYNKYKIPKISDRKKNIRETESAEVTENDINKNRISAKDIFVKELGEADCSTPIKSVVKVADDSDRKEVNKAFDLRSKLSSCRSLNHHFTKLRNLSEPERMHTEPIEDRESLLITLPNDTDVHAEPTTKRKLDDGNISKKKDIKTPIKKERISPKIKEACKSPKIKEVKSPSSKFKKIKLVINVICEKSETSSSESEDEESVENSDIEKKDIFPNLDLSFLDDFNIDEIIESLGGKEMPSYEFKDSTVDYCNLKPDLDHINDIDATKNNVYSALATDSENKRSLLVENDIETEEWTNESDVCYSSNNIEQLENALTTSLNDSAQEHIFNSKDEVLHMTSNKLPITDINNSASDTTTKQQNNSESCDVFSVNEYLKSEKETNAPLAISKTLDTLKTDNGGALGNEIKHRNELPVVLETDGLSAGINNTREAITDINSLQETNNNIEQLENALNTSLNDSAQEHIFNNKMAKPDNVFPSDLPSENVSEDISAIRKFLQTNDTSSEFSKNCSSTKDTAVADISNKMPEMNNTNRFETVHNSINIASNPVFMEKANKEIVIATQDTKKEEKNETQANNDTDCIDSGKNNTIQDNYESDIATNIKVSDYKGAGQEKLAQEVSETNQRINEINEPTELTNKARAEDEDETKTRTEDETEKQTNHIEKKNDEKDIQQNVDSNQHILHKINTEEIENNSTMEESNKDVNDNVDTKLEATHQTDPLLKTPSLVEKTKDHNTDSENKKEKELNISEITIDLTNESDENSEKVQGNCIANNKSGTKTTERNSQVVENCFTNDDVLDINTDVATKYIDFSMKPTTYLTGITIDLTQESNDNPDTANLGENCCAKDTDAIDDECGNNKESVTNTTKGSAIKVQENDINVTNDDLPPTKTTPESEKTCDKNYATTEESGTKTKEHKNLPLSENTCQSSAINKTDTVSEDKTKDKPEVTEDFLQMDASLAKNIIDKIQQWCSKKHTIKSLIHYGQFSKIYECVNECGDKYAVKIMHGNIAKYRFSKTESIMKRLQRDVPHENYHCVYLFQGLGSTTNWCLLMELYPKNLKQALQENEKSFHINLIQDLSRQLVSAVTLLRNKNIVHTNIKPTHILMNSTNNQLKLCGFDEAQYVGGIQFTRDIGAMNYRAPEIILGHSAGFQMDVWSTALVMYEMATNIQLFPGLVHNDILYKQMFVCGPVPYDMLKASRFKNEHFSGFTFLRKKEDGHCSKIPCQIMHKHDLIKKYVYLTYKQDWHGFTSYKQKQLDYAKLQHFCRLLHKMLTMDPKQRLPIEFVFADPFIYEGYC